MQETVGRYDFYLHCTSFFFVFISSIAIFYTFEGFVDRNSEVLCVYQSIFYFILSAFFLSCSFRLKSKYVSFVWLQPVRLQLLHQSSERDSINKRLPRVLQRVRLEWVWWVNFGSSSFFCNQFKSSVTCFTAFLSHAWRKSCLHTVQQNCLVLQFVTEFLWLRSVSYFGLVLNTNDLEFCTSCTMQFCSDHIAAGSTSSFYIARQED